MPTSILKVGGGGGAAGGGGEPEPSVYDEDDGQIPEGTPPDRD